VKTVKIKRYNWDEKQTLGICSVFDSSFNPLFSAISLERGWLENKRNVSCVPKGRYLVELEYSPRFKTKLWELKNVPNRSECKFHASNYWHQLNGCIALGRRPKDMNKDGYIDVTSSKQTMKDFHNALKGETSVYLEIE